MTFPQTVQDIKVELLSIVAPGVWTDVTTYVQRREGDGITITRGRSDETSTQQTSTAKMLFNNRDGRFSPRNPSGAYYGKLGRNTQLRVSILAGTSFRFWGEVSAWPTQQDITGRDIWVEVEAAGIYRRLGQGSAPLPSAMKRRFSVRSSVVGYWPGEDGDLATSISSGLVNDRAMTFNGAPELASYQGQFVGSRPIPTLNGAVTKGNIKTYTGTGSVHFALQVAIPSGGATDNDVIARLLTTGSTARWDLVYKTTSGGSLQVLGFASDGSSTFTSGIGGFTVNGEDNFVEVNLNDSGADVAVTIRVYTILAGTTGSLSYTATGEQITRATAIYLNPNGTMMDVAAGQVIVASDTTAFMSGADDFAAIVANNQERAAARISRLCSEAGINYGQVGSTAETPRMGPQPADTLLACLQECVDVDMGILHETRSAFGLQYRTRVSLLSYSQGVTATASVSAHELGSFQPVPDDYSSRNDITVERKRGGSVQISQLTGPLSTQAPPLGIGTYDDQVSVSLFYDADLPDQAGWRLRLGTIDEDRYPSVYFNMANPEIVANAALVTGLLALDPGDLLMITDPPSYRPPEDILQLTQGFTEFLSNFERQITVNCSPATAYTSFGVWGNDANVARYSSDGSTLNATMTTTATSVTVATPTGPLWLTTATIPGDFPFDIMVAGEQITVGAISGTTSPQTFSSLTRSVNGVVKTHAVGETVELFAPAYYSL